MLQKFGRSKIRATNLKAFRDLSCSNQTIYRHEIKYSRHEFDNEIYQTLTGFEMAKIVKPLF
jgi:hypothetical protein